MTVTIRVDVETRDRLRAIARREGRTIGDVAREAVEAYERTQHRVGL